MPTVKEILKKVRLLELKSRRLSNHVFSGEYHSAFKGRGMSFKEVREYAPGDDIRFIDWNVSARFGHPFSKVFEEERALTLMLMLDMSASNQSGTQQRSKQELMAEITAVLAFSAVANNDKVGAIFFTDKVELFIPPAKGKEHVLYLIRKALTFEPTGKTTNLKAPLHMLLQTMKHNTISFLFSDFYADNYQKMMKAAGVKHDCIAVHLFDVLETALPKGALIPLQDSETGEIRWMDTNINGFAQAFQQHFLQRANTLRQEINSCGWDYLRFRTNHDYVPALQQFFLKRINKK